MPRTLRSKKLRYLLFKDANGKCQICGETLDPNDWHADHIIPYSVSKRTNVHEMQALCPACNLKKGKSMLNFRRHQHEFEQWCKVNARTSNTITLGVTPGGGKSIIPLIACKELIPKYARKICWVVPRTSLARQADKDFIGEGPKLGLAEKIFRHDDNQVKDPCQGYVGYVTTYQCIQANPTVHIDAFRQQPFVLVLDEPHHLIDGKPWHVAIQKLYDLARFRILMSGSWETGSGSRIAFIDYERGPDGREYPSRPTITYSRKQALVDSSIVPIEFFKQDGWARWVDSDGKTVQSDSFDGDASENNQMLTAVLETNYALNLIDGCIAHWKTIKATQPFAKLLIVSPSITIANTYLKHIKRQHNLRAEIATSEDSANAETAMDNFKITDEAHHGKTDVLVTVAMAYEGMNVPSVTHICNLTRYRSKPWIEQMLARAVRNYKNKSRAYVWTPNDNAMNAIIEQLRNEQTLALREQGKKRPEGEGGGGGGNDTTIVGLESDTSFVISSELDGESYDRNETQEVLELAKEANLEFTSLSSLIKYTRLASSYKPKPSKPVDVAVCELTPRQEKDALRKLLQRRTNIIDKKRKVEPGTTNRELLVRFEKERKNMTNNELKRAIQWLDSLYKTN